MVGKQKSGTVVYLTSTTSGEGKSFLALLPSCTGIRWYNKLFRRMNDIFKGIVNNVPIGL
ncbi:hypothetical protein [Sphingobacterium sp. CZ-2]|uniref:hypothetical protein n=1 Tax=Sphingobacterium sp. CZ-2 TaxID=2557994 RepID=UPI00107061AB|nr:hypothetical protein [Sphingobacterium sp. CZ-2]QBR13583.1 hypothetical protein E3D81_15915 [Sphingobacterium sp. CZ-2]